MRCESRMNVLGRMLLVGTVIVAAGSAAVAQPTITVFNEDFQGLTPNLIPNVDEGGILVWTEVPPTGWTVDDSGIPGVDVPPLGENDGVTEWAGWSFAQKEWWIEVAGDQRRSEFTNGSGTIMIADPDEYDDLPHTEDGNYYNAYISIDNLDVSTLDGGTNLEVTFDSSWRPEANDDDWGQGDNLNNQTGTIEVRFDSDDPGDWVEIMRWESVAGPNFKDDNSTNENITEMVVVPGGGAANVDIRFGLTEAGNDWWWALDNIEIGGTAGGNPTVLLTEDFEYVDNPPADFGPEDDGVLLGPSVDEVPGPDLWTPDPPADWTVDRASVPGVGDPLQGVEEWEGWSFPRAQWWASVAGDDGRSDFGTSLDNIVAVVDPDEWDDLGDPENLCGTPPFCYNTSLTTPVINVNTINTATARLKFKSSWRQEDRQRALVQASWDAGPWEDVIRWESDGDPNHPANFKADATNEEINIALGGPIDASTLQLRFRMEDAGNDWWWAIDDIEVSGSASAFLVMLSEDFDNVVLGPCVDEQCNSGGWDGNMIWSAVPPAGWSVPDNANVAGAGDPTQGVEEWEGWTFANPAWWDAVAGQGRADFAVPGHGNVVAIADGDEWDDLGDPESIGLMNVSLVTPPIDVSAAAADSLTLTFDSSWRREDLQTAVITAEWDGGGEVEVLRWETAGVNEKPDATNETVNVNLAPHPAANKLVLRFKYLEAGNDWWWAIDNISVDDAGMNYLTEDFESVALGECVDEWCLNEFWTHEGPVIDDMGDDDPSNDNAWTIDNSNLPGIGNPAEGVVEWEGWSFAEVNWWSDGDFVDDQERSLFSVRNGGLGSGLVAVADGDEWDDRGDPENLCGNAPFCFNTILTSPRIDISGQAANTLNFSFDSSWRQEDRQTAVITVQYDGGAEVEVLRWESDGDPDHPLNFKDDAVSENVMIALNNPAPHNELVINFKMLDAGNDWWWAIDNVKVDNGVDDLFTEDFETAGLRYNGSLSGPVNELGPSEVITNVWTDTPPTGWFIDESGVPGAGGADDGVTEWAGWAIANASFWIQTDFQDREEFTKASGNVAVADPDEWDDQPHELGTYNTTLETPDIDLLNAQPFTAFVAFDSSWRPEDFQRARLKVSFDGGSDIELFRWTSDPLDPNFKPDATSESLLVPLNNPSGATTAKLKFEMFDAGNDWWWAIDNVFVFGAPPASDPRYDFDEDGDVDQGDFAFMQSECFGETLIFGVSPEVCFGLDIDASNVVDEPDWLGFENCASGPGNPADIACDD